MSSAANKKLSIVLPCYFPDPDWDQVVVEKFSELQQSLNGISMTLILVNDGTPDLNLPERLKKCIPKQQLIWISYSKNRGKGFALRTGVQSYHADYYLITDIDFPYQISSMAHMFQELISLNADIVVGVRDESYFKNIPFSRAIISKSLQWMNKYLLRLKVIDTQCGLKMFAPGGAALFLQTKLDGFLYDIELIQLATKKRNIKLESCNVKLNEEINVSPVKLFVLLKELGQFVKLFFR